METGSTSTASATTHSLETRDFPECGENRRVGAVSRGFGVSAEANGSKDPLLGLLSLVAKSRFPETETAVAETGSTEMLLSREAEHLALP